MSFLEKLNWRYATKKFDTGKPVSEADKNKILEAIRMAPTSFGFQPFQIEIVESKNTREELKKSAWNQSQVTDAPIFLVISARADLLNRVDEFMNLISGNDAEKRKSLESAEKMFKGAVTGMDQDKSVAWASKQAYIALGFALAACAELDLDSCPMEGFDADAFKKILNLPENLFPQAALAIGYRSSDDVIKPKNRFPKDELFKVI